ncbi:hypothetical protein MXMO3_03398 [Maritalea myrionectae]|uniref:Uncharacterized protein n=1 Tax=Maritalea myrionectae TaxID=454601 RepID=A0A2R4MIR0_9HYPH|nr:hypothetical protein MXMO3_03398 [Maritalea myrionectae]
MCRNLHIRQAMRVKIYTSGEALRMSKIIKPLKYM